MIDTRKSLVFLFVSALSLFAVGASVASADEFKANGTGTSIPVKVTGSESAVLDELATTGGTVVCEKITYSGTVASTPTTSVTLTPKYSECFIAEIIPVLIHVNSCDFQLTINPVSGKTDGWIDISCTKILDRITATVSVSSEGGSTRKCTIEIPPQTIGGVTYLNELGARVKASFNSTGVKYLETAGSGIGACKTTAETQSDGSYKGSAALSAEEDKEPAGSVAFSVQ